MISAQALEGLQRKAHEYVVPYSARHLQSHQEFVERNWPGSRLRKDPAYLAWRYHGSPAAIDNLLLLLVQDRVVGQMGLIPAKLHVDGFARDCHWICSLMVDPAHRGLGSWLLVRAIEMKGVLLGSDPSSLASVMLARLGFKTILGPMKAFLPLDIRHVLSWKLSPRAVTWAGRVLNPLNRLRRVWHFARRSSSTVRRIEWSDIADRVRTNTDRFRVSIVHDEPFLRWRLAESPNTKASILALAVGDSGYAICDVTPSNFYIADWHAANFEEAYALMRQCYRFAVSNGSKTLRALGNTEQERHWLKRLGLLSMRTPTFIYYYPSDAVPSTIDRFYYQYYDSDENI